MSKVSLGILVCEWVHLQLRPRPVARRKCSERSSSSLWMYSLTGTRKKLWQQGKSSSWLFFLKKARFTIFLFLLSVDANLFGQMFHFQEEKPTQCYSKQLNFKLVANCSHIFSDLFLQSFFCFLQHKGLQTNGDDTRLLHGGPWFVSRFMIFPLLCIS